MRCVAALTTRPDSKHSIIFLNRMVSRFPNKQFLCLLNFELLPVGILECFVAHSVSSGFLSVFLSCGRST